jgi:D-amino-acid dehydrogenase
VNVVVIGAGIIGVTTAYYLQRLGCTVTVIEERDSAAMVASHANGGIYSAGLSAPWAAPGAIGMALRSQFDPRAAFKLQPDFTLRQLRWVWQSMQACRADRFAANRARLTRLAMYARECLQEIESTEHIRYECGGGGVLQLLRGDLTEAAVAGQLAYLKSMGVPFELLSRDALIALEPALARVQPTGAVLLPTDSAGDCALFTRRLVAITEARGVTYRWNTTVDHVVTDSPGGRVRALARAAGDITADAYVVASGVASAELLQGTVNLPIYPIKGYSLTSTIVNPDLAPQRSLFDLKAKMGVARLGNTLRVSGVAEVVGFDESMSPLRRDQMAAQLETICPGAVDPSSAVFWTGLRPATPDGVPIIAKTAHENLFINAGHGGNGWSLSCGSGRLMAELVTNAKSSLSSADYGIRS